MSLKTKLFFVFGGIVLGCFGLIAANAGMEVSDSRPLCGTCHIMQQAAFTHKMSTHANLTCNECHAPYALGEKLIFKAKAGAKDIFLNTFGNTEFVTASNETKYVVNENCKRCHMATNQNVASMNTKEFCITCHRNVPHMRMKEITVREVGDV